VLTRLGVMPLSAVTAAIAAGRAAVPARSPQQTLKPAVVVPARRKREDEGESEDTVYYVDLAKREGKRRKLCSVQQELLQEFAEVRRRAMLFVRRVR
jgi:hypothetical protein